MKSKGDIGKALVLVSQLGINMLVPIFICLFAGSWLDDVLGTNFLTLILLLLGMMASIRSMFITLRPLMKGDREKEDEKFEKQFDEQFKDSE